MIIYGKGNKVAILATIKQQEEDEVALAVLHDEMKRRTLTMTDFIGDRHNPSTIQMRFQHYHRDLKLFKIRVAKCTPPIDNERMQYSDGLFDKPWYLKDSYTTFSRARFDMSQFEEGATSVPFNDEIFRALSRNQYYMVTFSTRYYVHQGRSTNPSLLIKNVMLPSSENDEMIILKAKYDWRKKKEGTNV